MNVTSNNPVRFSSTLTVDLGGTGIRTAIATKHGNLLYDPSDYLFRGATNVKYAEIDGALTIDRVFQTLTDKLLKTRLSENSKPFSYKNEKGDVEEKKLDAILKDDPIERILVCTAGQIERVGNSLQIRAAANMPAVLQDTDFIGKFRQILKDKLGEAGKNNYLAPSLENKGYIFNDALGSVMGLARHIETTIGQPLSSKTGNYVMMDVGSGIATGGINGNVLYTTESQNTATWHKSKVNSSLPARNNPTFEDLGSMRGMNEQTISALKTMSKEERVSNPFYQAIRKRALEVDQQYTQDKQWFSNRPEAFDEHFEKHSFEQLVGPSWRQKWVPVRSIIDTYLRNPDDKIAGPVMNKAFDALAALASNKIMEHKVKTVYLQFIDFSDALHDYNKERSAKGEKPIENPLTQEVLSRIKQYIHPNICKSFFDYDNGVQMGDFRVPEGLGYLPVALNNKTGNIDNWQIKDISADEIKKEVV